MPLLLEAAAVLLLLCLRLIRYLGGWLAAVAPCLSSEDCAAALMAGIFALATAAVTAPTAASTVASAATATGSLDAVATTIPAPFAACALGCATSTSDRLAALLAGSLAPFAACALGCATSTSDRLAALLAGSLAPFAAGGNAADNTACESFEARHELPTISKELIPDADATRPSLAEEAEDAVEEMTEGAEAWLRC